MTQSPLTTTGSAAPTRERTAGHRQAALLLAGSCMPVMGSVLITPVLPQLSQHFGSVAMADVLVPMIVTVPALLVAVFSPFAGQIVDRLGRKRLLLVAMFAYAVVGVAPAWLSSLGSILASRALVGVCEAAIMTVCTTLIVDYFHEAHQRNRYLSLQTVVTTLAATVFIAVGGAVGVHGWRTPFFIYALSLIIAIPMVFLLWEPTRPKADQSESAAVVRTPWSAIRLPVAITVVGGFTFYVFVIEASYLAVDRGIEATDTRLIGAIAAFVALATAIGGLLFPRLVRFGTRVLVSGAFGLQACGMILVFAIPGLPGLVIGAIVASFGSGILLPALLTWTVARVDFDERGRTTGWFLAAFFFGQFVTPILMNGIAVQVGGLSPAIGVVGLIAGLMALGTGAIIREKRQSLPQ
ncbi:MFS transporter [Gordonia sp. CPCC 205515]|uniref:MFS transporter n=1 Tax=Gordonia sp. CPCC 205515 TaxID=3140791 RepID=UPI003AF39135